METKGTANTLSVFSLLEAFRRRKLLITFPALLLTVGAAMFAYKQPNLYKAQVLVAAEHLTPPGYLREVAPEPLNIQEHLWTVREVLFRPDVLQEIAHGTSEFRSVKGPIPEASINAFKAR